MIRPHRIYLAVTAVAVWFSTSIFHPDEYCQTIEFAAVKLGRVPPSQAALELKLAMRPWFQPSAYVAILRVLGFAGLHDPFLQVAVLRALHAALFALALTSLMRFAWRNSAERERPWQSFVWLFAFLPYLSVRTSSENLSASLLALAFVTSETTRRPISQIFGWFLFGLAFEARYQVLLAICGYLAWIAVFRAWRARKIAYGLVGFCVALGMGVLLDHWGYGRWTLPLVNYIQKNVFEGMAAGFGRAPIYAYLYLPLTNVALPAAVLCMLGTALYVIRRPMEPMSWMLVFFFVGHSLIGHKEERFLFPLVPFAIASSSMSLNELRWRAPKWLKSTYFTLNSISLLWLALIPLNWRGSIRVHTALHEDSTGRPIRVIDATPNGVMSLEFYVNVNWDRWNGEKVSCDANESTYLVVDALHAKNLPEPAPGCALVPTMNEFDAFWPIPNSVMETLAAREVRMHNRPILRYVPLPQWHALYHVVRVERGV